jgi:hypothetical protein
MNNNTVALNILKWLGGNKFLAMTGTTNLIYDNDFLSMKLKNNQSKTNKLEINLNNKDLYDIKFYKYIPLKFNSKTGKFSGDKIINVVAFKDVHGEDLQRIFTEVTGFDTHL